MSFELADQFFPLNWVTWATTKNFSSLGAWEEPPLFMPNYTKEFPENTKEKSELQYFEFFYVLNLQNVNEWHMATILRSWRFFWHPYWHIHPWHMADAICYNYVINAKNGIIDIIAYDICHGWICQYGCQKNRQDLRIAAKCHSLIFWRIKSQKLSKFWPSIFPFVFSGNSFV